MFVMKVPNFSLKQTYNVGQCLKWQELNNGKNGYIIISGKRFIHVSQPISFLNREQISFNCSEDEFFEYWYYYFDICTDYNNYIYSVDKKDEYLKRCTATCGGTRFINQGMWESILESVLSDDLSIHNSRQKVKDFCSIFSKGVKKTIDGMPFNIYPTPTYQEIIEKWHKLEMKPKENECILKDEAFNKAYTLSLSIMSGEIDLKEFVTNKEKRRKATDILDDLLWLTDETKNRIELYALRNRDAYYMNKSIKPIIDISLGEDAYKAYSRMGSTDYKYKGHRGILFNFMKADEMVYGERNKQSWVY